MTAQVGPQLAEYLGIPQLAYAMHIELMANKVRVNKNWEISIDC